MLQFILLQVIIFAAMKRLSASILVSLFCFIFNNLKAQDTLPKFNIRDINDTKVLVTWINPYEYNCIQLAVQRSFDSTQFFSTIYSAQSPELPQNGIVELRMPKGVKVFYRIFYVLEGGKYFFSKSIGLNSYTSTSASKVVIEPIKRNFQREVGNQNQVISLTPTIPSQNLQVPEVKVWLNIFKRNKDTLLYQVEQKNYRKFRDSIILKTKDTLFSIDPLNIVILPFVPKPQWKPSQFVFATESANRVIIHLPAPKLHRYKIIFYDSDGSELFQIKQPKDADLILDNSNFLHGGWFSFDLFEDEKLKEHNKFQLLIPF